MRLVRNLFLFLAFVAVTITASSCDDGSVSIKAEENYLLIPSSNSGSRASLSIFAGDENILGEPQFIMTAGQNAEYCIPVDISKYKGQTLKIVMEGVEEGDLSLTCIKQSPDRGIVRDEKYRQVYHFTPDFGWTNDPNGMVYADGEYHLAYQSNPYGTKHSNMHWGNAVSTDLMHWQDLPFIIAPDSLGAIFSGSAVVDETNSAGFGENAIVAMYTSASIPDYSTQRQSLAYSTDGGRTYTKYDANPVLNDPEKQPNFRDPKVIRYGDKWVVSVAAGDVIAFYQSDDLKNWEKLSEFGKGIGSHAAVWECPDLMKFEYNGESKWVLIVNINPGGPNGGSATQYFIGDFDGKEFKADDLPYPLWVDEGMDNYAGVTFSNTGDRHIFLGWMSNWFYSNSAPSINFRNSMTLPRDLSLKDNGTHLFLASTPSEEVYAARVSSTSVEVGKLSGTFEISQLLEENDGAYEIDFTVLPGNAQNFGFKLYNEAGESLDYNFDFASMTLSLDRSKSGNVDFDPKFSNADIHTGLIKRPEYKVKLFIDRQSSEMFVNDGDVTFTNGMFPSACYNSASFTSEGASVKDVVIYKIG